MADIPPKNNPNVPPGARPPVPNPGARPPATGSPQANAASSPAVNSRGDVPGARTGVPAVLPPGTKTLPPAAPVTGRASDILADHATRNSRSGMVSTQPENLQEIDVDQSEVIQFINRILAKAIRSRASDIHFEPRRDKTDIRYRIDGTLHRIDSIPRSVQEACVSRIKVMADMDISERRLPQDGRIAVTIEHRNVDLRVSSLPTQYGESVVLRILDKGGTRPTLDQLGFSERNLDALNSVIRKPHGIFLATGPTGSGKTTTLYSAIQEIHTDDVNIITVEDPVEYDLDGIRQSNVNEKAGLTFAKQLRAILRQDPDIIYVGEIRDAETAEIAFRAALTGHLVFSTLHCNDAAGAVTRLLNMGVDPFLVASSVIGILAQRLVRKVCQDCAVPAHPSRLELSAFGLTPDSPELAHAQVVVGTGCEVCGNAGYHGRYCVQEMLVMDDDIRELVLDRAPAMRIRQLAVAHGMVPMREDVKQKVLAGITTFSEAQKRVFVEEEPDKRRGEPPLLTSTETPLLTSSIA